jgi:DNA-binding MarR family transcriptional regulator
MPEWRKIFEAEDSGRGRPDLHPIHRDGGPVSEQGDQTVSALGEELFLESNTLTPILKKLEQTGYVSRIRDPADERQVRVSLTAAGRRLLENDLGGVLVEACGLGDEFSVVQKNVVRLRDNLLRNTRGKQDET